MDNNDKLYECANSYNRFIDYEYKLSLYNNGTIINTTINFDISSFMHLSGLEKLTDLTVFSNISSSRLYDNIMNNSISYQDVCSSDFWGTALNDPQTNNVTYTLEDRIETLTKFRDVLNNRSVKAYSWNPDCHNSYRPYNSEIKADFMLVFESDNPKTSDERIYAFFKLDKNNPNIAHGISQFPTDRTYNNDGRRSVPEITVISLIEHDKVNNVDRVITELPVTEQQRLIEKSLKNSEYATIKADLKQLKSKRTKYLETNTAATQKAYEKRLSIFCNRNIYTDEMLRSVADRLVAQAQDPNNKQAKNLILKEAEFIKAELANREKSKNAELSSSITIMKSVHNNDEIISLKPLVTIETPKSVIKAKSKIEKGTHLADSSIRNVFSDIKSLLKEAVSKFKNNVPEKKSTKSQTVKSKPKAVQSFKPEMPVQAQKQEKEKVPMFSIAELQSDKYTPTSSKGEDIGRTKNNDLDL